MQRFLAAVATALTLSACADVAPTAVSAAHDGPVGAGRTSFLSSTQWNIFTTQTPAATWTASGVEVGTRFKATQKGCVTGFRFWRADGETGTHTIKLWLDSGALWTSKAVTLTGAGTGWQYAYATGFACLTPGAYYRVSVNTSTKHVETVGAFSGGSTITNGPLVATSGYYGQPAGSFPTIPSSVNFFVDVIFDTSITY
jgi:hypothetical protein